MPYTMTRTNQIELLNAALELTQSEGWHKDAVAYAAIEQSSNQMACIGVFQNFAGGSAEFHFSTAGRRLNKTILESYKFIAFHPRMMGLKRIFANVAASNANAQKACLNAGFTFQYRKPSGAAGGEDAIVLMLVPSNEPKHAQEVRSDQSG